MRAVLLDANVPSESIRSIPDPNVDLLGVARVNPWD
jgi:hypothetical protein